MKKSELAVMTVVALGAAACEPATLGPEPRTVPASSPVAAMPSDGADYAALLQAMHPGQPVTAEQRRTTHALDERLAKLYADAGLAAEGSPALSPAAERALREFAASPGGQA